MTTMIEWTDETWNPTTGCDKVSAGCDHCYIERTIPFRIEGRRFDEKGKMGVLLHPDRLDKPLHWRKPRRVFVNSLSDLFHPDVPPQFIVDVFVTMGRSRRHTYQVLTKRPQRMATVLADPKFDHELYYGLDEYVPEDADALATLCEWEHSESLPNVWLGTSIESDHYAFRADHLRATPADVRFLSLEPLLGPLPSLDLTGIDWVIVGGESGPNARPMHPAWVRDIRDRCVAAGIPFFLKQWGEWGPAGTWPGPDHHITPDGKLWAPGEPCGAVAAAIHRWGKKAAGRQLDGRTWDEMPIR